jgi:uncharacterized DUF497 family protein
MQQAVGIEKLKSLAAIRAGPCHYDPDKRQHDMRTLLTRATSCHYIPVVTWRMRDALRWTWDDDKNRTNKRAHGLSFETAQLVFRDPLAASRRDPHPDEERWQTIGLIGQVVVFVVHIWPEPNPDTRAEVGWIISARKATAHERRAYEEEAF